MLPIRSVARKILPPRIRRTIRNQIGSGQPPTGFDQVNEAINLDTNVLFVAVPKTGSTTLRAQVRSQGRPLVPHPHLNIVQLRECLYVYLLLKALGKNASFPNAERPMDEDVRATAQERFRGLFKFSSVRNPWARTVSLYYRNEGIKTSDTMSFRDFCDRLQYASDTCTHPTRHQNQLDWLTDESGKLAMDYVLKIEELPQKHQEIAEQSGHRVVLSPTLERNVNPKSRSRSYKDLYDDVSKHKVARLFEADIDTFKYSF